MLNLLANIRVLLEIQINKLANTVGAIREINENYYT